MAEDLLPVWDPLEYSWQDFPTNLGKRDDAALSDEQKEKLQKKLMSKRHEDLEYLHSTPMIRAIIHELFQQVITFMPIEIEKFIRHFFNQPKEQLRQSIEQHLKLFPKMKPATKIQESTSFFAPSHSSLDSISSIDAKAETETTSEDAMSSPRLFKNLQEQANLEEDIEESYELEEENIVYKSMVNFETVDILPKKSEAFEENEEINRESEKSKDNLLNRKETGRSMAQISFENDADKSYEDVSEEFSRMLELLDEESKQTSSLEEMEEFEEVFDFEETRK